MISQLLMELCSQGLSGMSTYSHLRFFVRFLNIGLCDRDLEQTGAVTRPESGFMVEDFVNDKVVRLKPEM